MEVMNRAELTQTDILVGQKNATRSFGVSDDPMLMSMLSTGFYQNPLRTMIQEIMFNAWDAHRMGNCQHRPIDVYINDTTGLIVRDYGPGIEPGEDDDNMHEIYCMYGGSTKRKLKNQTGGFGLGSKSPFAYTESFTVTSHFGGIKNMYLISRVSESNGGKPGMTSLVRVPTTETGLMVTVPLKLGHMERTYEHVKDVLFLSGIKAMIHYADQPDEFIDSFTLPPGQYFINEERYGSGIYAVYGGVRYAIPHEEEYAQEYKFMQLLAGKKDMFVGFAPDSLSPLPNREGLNMGEKSKETVKATFELCTEKFQETFEPVTKAFFKVLFDSLVRGKIQGKFAFIKASTYAVKQNAVSHFTSFNETILPMKPDHISEDIWKIATNLVINQTDSVLSVVGKNRWKVMFIRAFIEAYPEDKDLAFSINKFSFDDIFPQYDSTKPLKFACEFYKHKFLVEQHQFVTAMKEAYPTDDSLHPQMRLWYRDKWDFILQYRSMSNLRKTNYTKYASIPRKKGKLSFNSVYRLKDGEEINFLMMDKTVILAKNAKCLNNTMIPLNIRNHNTIVKNNFRYYSDVSEVVPAYVVHERRGAYNKALEILQNMGFNVIEGPDPEKKDVVTKEKVIPTFSKIQPRNDNWQSKADADQFTDPTHFWYGTLATITGYSSRERPDMTMVYWFLKKNPKTVVVTNIRTADNMEKEGVLNFNKAIVDWYNTKSQDLDRMTNIVRASKILSLTNLPDDLLYHPLMQLELGMEPVDPTDTDFWYDAEGFNHIANSDYYAFGNLKAKVKLQLEDLWKTDPERDNIIELCGQTKMFERNALSSLWSSTKPSDQDEMVGKIIAAMKLFY